MSFWTDVIIPAQQGYQSLQQDLNNMVAENDMNILLQQQANAACTQVQMNLEMMKKFGGIR